MGRLLSLVPLSQRLWGTSEERIHASVTCQAIVAIHFPALDPCQCTYRSCRKSLDAQSE